ncbi:MAG: amino acid-binding protein [Firmicutes bacterium]|nr:amino acid-binding protein [Bacillota bacterium]
MGITQFRIVLSNKPGALAEIAHRIGYAGINIRGISLMSVDNESILHLVVNDPVATWRVFKEAGIDYEENRVIAVELPNVPGALSECSKVLSELDINIDYLYPFIARTPNAIVIIKTGDMEKTEAALLKRGINILTEEQLYKLE